MPLRGAQQVAQCLDRRPKVLTQERRDVAKQNSRLWEVGHSADPLLGIGHAGEGGRMRARMVAQRRSRSLRKQRATSLEVSSYGCRRRRVDRSIAAVGAS